MQVTMYVPGTHWSKQMPSASIAFREYREVSQAQRGAIAPLDIRLSSPGADARATAQLVGQALASLRGLR